jgi:hypothetical protein
MVAENDPTNLADQAYPAYLTSCTIPTSTSLSVRYPTFVCIDATANCE